MTQSDKLETSILEGSPVDDPTKLDLSTEFIDELDSIHPGLWEAVKLYAKLSQSGDN